MIPQAPMDPAYYRPTRFITKQARKEARRGFIKKHGGFFLFMLWLVLLTAYLIREAV